MKVCLNCNNPFTSDNWVCSLCGFETEVNAGINIHAPNGAAADEGFSSDYFSVLFNLEKNSFWFRARSELISWAIRRYKPDISDFLEVGCGTGFVLSCISKEFPNLDVSGSEIFFSGLEFAAERVPAAKLMQMDARRIPFIDEFSAIGAFDVLEHIYEDQVVLNQCYSALKAGGLLILTVPQHPWLWSVSDDYAFHVRRYKIRELDEKVKKAGFKIIRSTSFVSLLVPLIYASRAIWAKNKDAYDPTRELKTPSLLNHIFYAVMKIEALCVQAGINFVIGGSRLIVASK